MISYTAALKEIIKHKITLPEQTLPLKEAYGMVLSEPIIADRDYPPFNRSAMDGYAFRYDDFNNENSEITAEVVETIYPAKQAEKSLSKKQVYSIMTGAAVPEDADTVIRREDVIENETSIHFNPNLFKKGSNIAKKGEDILKNDIITKTNCLLDIATTTTLANLGYNHVQVVKQPSIAIINTGNELIELGEPINPLEIRNSNRYTLEAGLSKLGLKPKHVLLASDTKADLKNKLESVLDCDIIILTGAVSMGKADFVPAVVQELGFEKVFHKVKIKPGKPVFFGRKNNKVVFGLPGNPLSVQVTFKLFVEPFIHNILGLEAKNSLFFKSAQTIKAKPNLDVFIPCILNKNQKVEPLKFNGSGDVRASLASHGIAKINASNNILENELLEFVFW